MSYLELNGVTKTYRGAPEPTLKELNLDVEKGEILVMLGASGCGKTTTLRVVAGLEQQESGQVLIDGQCMNGLKPERRPIAMVFQKSLLFRNMTVAENIGFAPRLNHTLTRHELARRTDEMLSLMRLEGLGERRVSELSGGQEQRVSLARALMIEPKLLLLDEPLSALDAELRVTMREHIKMLNNALTTTMLFVTHDQAEAVSLGHRIALMDDGRIVQCASPDEFYSRPANQAVAAFFGWKNFLPADATGDVVDCALGRFELTGLERWMDNLVGAASETVQASTPAPLSAPLPAPIPEPMLPQQAGWQLVIRPEAAMAIGTGSLTGTVLSSLRTGMSVTYRLRVGEIELEIVLNAREQFEVGELICFDLDPEMMWYVPASGSSFSAKDIG